MDVPSLTPVNSNTTDKLNQITLCCGNSPVHYKMSGITSSLHLSTPAPARAQLWQSQRLQMLPNVPSSWERGSEPIRGPTQGCIKWPGLGWGGREQGRHVEPIGWADVLGGKSFRVSEGQAAGDRRAEQEVRLGARFVPWATVLRHLVGYTGTAGSWGGN